MRTLYLLIALYTGLFLSACSTASNSDQAAKTQNATSGTTRQAAIKLKNPLLVTVYTEKQPLPASYTILGQATILKYNLRGIKRQEAYIHDAMRALAASMGGDAVINLNKNDKTVTGTVIAYQDEKKQKLSSV